MTGLRAFLTRLATDPEALAAYLRDPQAAAEAAGLDAAARQALGGGAGAIWDVLLGRPRGDIPAPEPPASDVARQGSLVVIGTGIRTVGHLTIEAMAWMRIADDVLYVVADPIAEEVIRALNPNGAMSLRGYYGEGVNRQHSYEAMTEHMLSCVRAGHLTCVALYGHPGVFAYPAHEAVRRARAEGYRAQMLPGISAEDCLFADLGVDPAVTGCQSFEATDFLVNSRAVDTASQLILWQVGVFGDQTYRLGGYYLHGFPLLVARLSELYGAAHEVIVYEAPLFPGVAPVMTRIALAHLTQAYVHPGSTLYVPPGRPTVTDRALATALGLQSRSKPQT
jgi:Tetrapyrrole (Corrin/Porphyrin) Methylases